jgi:hypothetical protein
VQRLLRRPALPVDGGAGHGVGIAGREQRVAAEVQRLLADLRHAPHDHVVDHAGVEVVAHHQRGEHVGGEVHRVPTAELPVAAAERCADGVDDDGGRHARLPHSRPTVAAGPG